MLFANKVILIMISNITGLGFGDFAILIFVVWLGFCLCVYFPAVLLQPTACACQASCSVPLSYVPSACFDFFKDYSSYSTVTLTLQCPALLNRTDIYNSFPYFCKFCSPSLLTSNFFHSYHHLWHRFRCLIFFSCFNSLFFDTGCCYATEAALEFTM